MKNVRNIYLSRRFFYMITAAVMLFILSYFFQSVLIFARIFFFSLVFLTLMDCLLMLRTSGIDAVRNVPDKLSNGDDNPVDITVENWYMFPVDLEIIDELPFQFQKRDMMMKTKMKSGSRKSLSYLVRPVERGEYHFGSLNVYTASPIGLLSRRFRFQADMMVPVYPSIIQMRKYDLYAVSNRLSDSGLKKIRRPGASMEFDQIRKYFVGDDYRKINWKASARKSDIMVNQYRDEKSQNVYSIIDTGRVMKMPFENMTLLDYAINASLVISNVAIRKEDRAGIVLFSNTIESQLPASRQYSQIFKILELLYNCRPRFQESSFEHLYAGISRSINRRSLILLYTNFETMSSMKRNLSYLSMIARKHFLVIVFFVNTELDEFLDNRAESIDMVYVKTIAKKFSFEKKQIVKELERYGIQSILTTPDRVTVDSINKYIELKMRGLL